jgi:hypothetical protein
MPNTPTIDTDGHDAAASTIETAPSSRTDLSTVDDLLKTAAKIYSQSLVTRRTLLYERVELGRVLIQLKDAVGHKYFMAEFHKWIKSGRIGFSLKTGQRAMAYAELEKDGKFVDDAKNDIVSNLAEAERLRKVEAARKKAEQKEADESSEQDSVDSGDDAKLVTLKDSQIGPKAKKLAMPLFEECRGYDGDTRTKLLEELIELLSEELEK